MNRKIRIYKLVGVASVITLVGGGGVALSLAIVNKDRETILKSVEHNVNGTNGASTQGRIEPTYIGNIFPTLEATSLYDDLRIENREAVITDDLLANVVNTIIQDSKYINTEGLYWDYEYDNSNELRVTFNWPVNGVHNVETYKVKLYMDRNYETQIANIENIE